MWGVGRVPECVVLLPVPSTLPRQPARQPLAHPSHTPSVPHETIHWGQVGALLAHAAQLPHARPGAVPQARAWVGVGGAQAGAVGGAAAGADQGHEFGAPLDLRDGAGGGLSEG